MRYSVSPIYGESDFLNDSETSLYDKVLGFLRNNGQEIRMMVLVIKELRCQSQQTAMNGMVEDFVWENGVAPQSEPTLKKLLGMEHFPSFYFN